MSILRAAAGLVILAAVMIGSTTARAVEAVNVPQDASALDLTKAGLYYYIESKEDLLYAIMNFAMGRLETLVIEPSRSIADPQ